MAAKGTEGRRGRRPGVVKDVRRGGPPRGFWVALGALALVGIAALAWLTSRPKGQVARLDPSLPALKAEGYVLGSPTAPVEVVEFADFECPACGQYATITEPDVRARLVNTGRVRFRFMDFPLPMHKNTWDASLAAACANDQGKFWEMHDAIFAAQDRWNTEATGRPRKVMEELARGVGVDMTRYNACMEADTHRAKVQSHLAEAERRQIRSTPTFVFNGLVVQGALPYDEFKRRVDEAAAAAPRAPAAAAPASDAAVPATLAPAPAGASPRP